MRCSLTSLDEVGSNIRIPLWDQATAEFCFAKSRELLTKPFPIPQPPHNSLRDINYKQDYHFREPSLNYMYTPSYHPDRCIPRSECMSRKTYSNFHRACPATSSFSIRKKINYLESPFPVYDPESSYENAYDYENSGANHRPRALSFSDTPHLTHPRKSGKSIRDRNRRRQSYNPRVYDSSSSDTECESIGSVDFDWRRRRRLSSFSLSNGSIRSEMNRKSNFLKPEVAASNRGLGRSPPPSSTVLSGLSPTTVARCLPHSDSSSSNSDL